MFRCRSSSKGDSRRRAHGNGEEVRRLTKSGIKGPNRDGHVKSELPMYVSHSLIFIVTLYRFRAFALLSICIFLSIRF